MVAEVVGIACLPTFLAHTWCCQGPKAAPWPHAEDHELASLCGFLLTSLHSRQLGAVAGREGGQRGPEEGEGGARKGEAH